MEGMDQEAPARVVLETLMSELYKAVLVLDDRGHVRAHNERFEELVADPDRLLDGEPSAAMPEKLRTHLTPIKPAQEDAPAVVQTPDGRLLDLRVRSLGEPTGSTGEIWLLRDVTERHVLASQLDGSVETLAALVEAASVPIVALDTEGRVTLWNPEAERLFGWTEEEARGQLPPMLPPEERARFQEDIGRVLQGSRMQTIRRAHRRRGDGVIPIKVSVSPVYGTEGDVRGAIGTLEELTEETALEQALWDSARRFRQIAEHLDVVLWINQPDLSEVLYVSPAYEDIWGRPAEEHETDPIAWFRAIHPEDKDRIRAEMDAYDPGAGELELHFRIVRPDGEVRRIEAEGFSVRDGQDKIDVVIGTARDVTGERRPGDDLG